MPGRRGGAAIPLITLIVSFVLVLALGGWLGKSEPDKPTPVSARGSVHLVLQDLSDTGGVLRPFPGLAVTISPASKTKGKKPDGVATGTVTLCITPGDGWRPATPDGSRWTRQSRTNQFCRAVSSTNGQIDPVGIWLERS